MDTERANDAKVERGSAMIISVLVSAILSLLGISYLLMADTENKIAENEKLSGQALYFGEATVREVKRWFDRPPYVGATSWQKNLVRPLPATMDRTQRWIDTDGDGPTLAQDADGSVGLPYWKDIDADGNGTQDIFEKPYRSAFVDMLLGTEDHPDVRIARSAGGATATLLDNLATKIAPNFPASAVGLTARVNTIDIYEPPYLNVGGGWTRYGMGTVKVTVEIVKGTQVVATKVVKAVLNETPYPGPFGPLHSCSTLNWNGAFKVHWGTSTTVGIADPKSLKMPDSIPRSPTIASPKVDLLNGWQSPLQDATWTAMKTALEAGTGKTIEDPWYRFMSGGFNKDFAGILTQQINAPITTDQDQSNIFHRLDPIIPCPEFEYQTWKDIAQSGNSDTHYYTWSSGASFTENGSGAVTDMRTLTDNKTGLFFFDTTDGNPPDSATPPSNLTPEILVSGGTYGTRGMIYLNTSNWETKGLAGRPIDMIWPGEPFRDKNQNGVRDTGEEWINLNYKTISTTDPTVFPKALGSDDYGNIGLGQAFNKYGPPITGYTAAIWGVLYVAGTLDAEGNADYYGSVVTKGGTADKMTGNPSLWWDPRMADNWPPPDWDLPRVIITRWQTDL